MTRQKGDGKRGAIDRRSLSACVFAQRWRDHLLPIYKEYQKRMLCVHGPKLKFEAVHRKLCVQALLDSSFAVHSKKDHKAFKDAVQGELYGDGTPR